MLIYSIRESIEVCAQVFIDLEPNKDDHLASQAASFVENSLSMCTSLSLSYGELILTFNQVRRKRDNYRVAEGQCFYATAVASIDEVVQRVHSNSFFDALRSCIENSSRGSPGSQGLRDMLLRDTASRIVETDAENFQLVMHNFSLFIDKVHNGAYDLGLVRRKPHRRLFIPLFP